MTKKEMLLEMLEPINWNQSSKEEHLKRGLTMKKSRVEECYRFFCETEKTSKDGWFCINCVTGLCW